MNKTMGAGRKAVNKILDTYGEVPVVDLVNDTWKNRPKTNIVKWLLLHSSTSKSDLANYLNCSVQYLENKFTRNSFSFDDVMIAAYACGYDLFFIRRDETEAHKIDAKDYFSSNEDVWKRISSLKENEKDDRRIEYEDLKAKLDRMKKQYGFED